MTTLSKWDNAFSSSFSSMVENLIGRNFDNIMDSMSKGTVVPAVNVVENKDNYIVEVAAPGFKKEDFKINITDNLLTISSEREAKKEKSTKKYTRKEYEFSSFSRAFSLPEDVDADDIHASYENGELSIKIKRKETKNSKKKEVKIS